MSVSYDRLTVNSPNPLARFSHRNRMKKSVALVLKQMGNGPVLDYGCGSGALVDALNRLRPGCAVGYEPFMKEKVSPDVAVFSELSSVENSGPFSLITLFETIEHLHEPEVVAFLDLCKRLLPAHGGVLVSAPVEIGPALIAKELNRSIQRARIIERHGFLEFLKASIFAIPAKRAENIKVSHRGFDFRRAIDMLGRLGWNVEILQYGPLPINTWYGNSQVYFWATRKEPVS